MDAADRALMERHQAAVARTHARRRVDPSLVGDLVSADGDASTPAPFPFRSWAATNQFAFDPAHLALYQRCSSAAVVFFLRALLARAVTITGPVITDRTQTSTTIGVVARGLRVDALVEREVGFILAVDIDPVINATHITPDALRATYLRGRRLAAAGYTPIRFTAQETFANPTECWSQIDAILAVRRPPNSPT